MTFKLSFSYRHPQRVNGHRLNNPHLELLQHLLHLISLMQVPLHLQVHLPVITKDRNNNKGNTIKDTTTEAKIQFMSGIGETAALDLERV